MTHLDLQLVTVGAAKFDQKNIYQMPSTSNSHGRLAKLTRFVNKRLCLFIRHSQDISIDAACWHDVRNYGRNLRKLTQTWASSF